MSIEDVKVFAPKKFGDERGFFSETYNQQRLLEEQGIECSFVQDNQSLSRAKYVMRGLHFQTPPFAQDKLVRVIKGRILDVAVDIRKGSPTYGQHIAVELSEDNWQQIFVPKGFAHAFLTLEENTEVFYKVSAPYAPECDAGILWNDPDLGIDWPVDPSKVMTSDKDAVHPCLKEYDSPFIYGENC